MYYIEKYLKFIFQHKQLFIIKVNYTCKCYFGVSLPFVRKTTLTTETDYALLPLHHDS